MTIALMIRFGAASPLLKAQLRAQGLPFDSEEIEVIQKLADASVLLSFHGCITDPALHSLRKKLLKKIERTVNKRITTPTTKK